MLSVGLPVTRPLAGAVDTCPVRAPSPRSNVDGRSALLGGAAPAGPGWKEVAAFRKEVAALRARQSIVTRTGVRRCGAKKKECSNELSLLA